MGRKVAAGLQPHPRPRGRGRCACERAGGQVGAPPSHSSGDGGGIRLAGAAPGPGGRRGPLGRLGRKRAHGVPPPAVTEAGAAVCGPATAAWLSRGGDDAPRPSRRASGESCSSIGPCCVGRAAAVSTPTPPPTKAAAFSAAPHVGACASAEGAVGPAPAPASQCRWRGCGA